MMFEYKMGLAGSYVSPNWQYCFRKRWKLQDVEPSQRSGSLKYALEANTRPAIPPLLWPPSHGLLPFTLPP